MAPILNIGSRLVDSNLKKSNEIWRQLVFAPFESRPCRFIATINPGLRGDCRSLRFRAASRNFERRCAAWSCSLDIEVHRLAAMFNLQQLARLYQVRCTEAFGKPIVCIGEDAARIHAPALFMPQSADAHGGAKFK